MRSLILLVFGIVVALSAPAGADQILDRGKVIEGGPNAGDVLLGSLRIGRKQAGQSTLDISVLRAMPSATGALGTLERRLADLSVDVSDYCSDTSGAGDSQACLQQAMNAAATSGRTLVRFPVRGGSVYKLSGQVYVPSNVTVDCGGAIIRLDPAVPYVNAAFWVGNSDLVTPSDNVSVTGCIFESALAFDHGAILIGKGSKNVRVAKNNFRAPSGYGLNAVRLAFRDNSNITFSDNILEDVRYALFVNADETQGYSNCRQIPSGANCNGGTNPLASPVSSFSVPAAMQADIAAGYGYGVIVYNRFVTNNTKRLFGPYDGGSDFTYAGGTLTFSPPIAASNDVSVEFFTWNPSLVPANNLNGVQVSNNIGRRIRGAAVQFNCPVRAIHRRPTGVECPRNIQVTGNTFDGAYQLDGVVNLFDIGAGATNRVLYSEDFSNSAWVKGSLTVVSGRQAPPFDGRYTAQKLVEGTANSGHSLYQVATMPSAGNAVFSCHAKAAGRNRLQIYNATTGGNGVAAQFDLTSGTVVFSGNQGAGSGVAAGVWSEGEGWWRIWLSGYLNDAGAQPLMFLADGSGSINYAGDGTSGVELWGCQLEPGETRPHAYMPTAGSAVRQVTTQLISMNGVSDFVVANNALGPAMDQCIHTEDKATNGTISGNICRNPGGNGIYLSDSRNITVTGNVVYGSYLACGALDANATGVPTIELPYITNDYIVLRNNACLGGGVPTAISAWRIMAAGSTPVSFSIGDNIANGMPAGVSTYTRLGTTLPVLSGAGTGATLSAGATDLGGEVNSGSSASGFVVTFAFAHPSMTCTVTGLSGTTPATVTTTATALTVTHAANSSQRFAYACHEGQ